MPRGSGYHDSEWAGWPPAFDSMEDIAAMGFFAAELESLLRQHSAHPQASPWAILSRLGVHPQQVDRLKKAADDPRLIATLPEKFLPSLQQELGASPQEWARLMAGIEADVAIRMTQYHGYDGDEGMNTGNAIFSAMLKDRLAQIQLGDAAPEILSALDTTMQRAGRGRRGRGIRRRVENVEADQSPESRAS